MDRCFVIQPFDSGPFDARFDDVLAPAIRAAGLEPYRVDRDPGTTIPIQDIENEIRSSVLCLADITLDNPNIWFELGFAIASQKDVVLICADQRATKFPFDVQHRSIITYKTGSTRDFEQLSAKISERMKALLLKEKSLTAAAGISQLQKLDGLGHHEIVALAAIGGNTFTPDGVAGLADVRRDMDRSGSTAFATMVSLKSLKDMRFIEVSTFQDSEGYSFEGCILTERGWAWIMENKNKFALEKPTKQSFDDDLPF